MTREFLKMKYSKEGLCDIIKKCKRKWYAQNVGKKKYGNPEN